MAIENEQLLKNVKLQEVNSLVQTPRSDDPASGNRFRICLQNFETLEKSIQYKSLRKFVILERVSIGMRNKTIAYVDDGFGDRTPACREYAHTRADSDSGNYAAIQRRSIIGPVIQVHITQFLGTLGVEVQVPFTTTPNRTSRVVIC